MKSITWPWTMRSMTLPIAPPTTSANGSAVRQSLRGVRDNQNASRPLMPTPRAENSQRSEEHTSELQSLMRSSHAVFCLHKETDLAAARAEPAVGRAEYH